MHEGNGQGKTPRVRLPRLKGLFRTVMVCTPQDLYPISAACGRLRGHRPSAIYHRPRILPKCDRGFTGQMKSSPQRFFLPFEALRHLKTKILKLNAQRGPPIKFWLDNVRWMSEEEAPEGLYQEAPA